MRATFMVGTVALAAISIGAPPVVRAQSAPTDQAPGAPAAWTDTLKLSGHLEAGITGNIDGPHDQRNFGRLFDETGPS